MRLLLAKPLTYMNRSGNSVGPLLQRHHLTAAGLIVVCDDLALPFGKLRVRPRGSSGGHRGLQSIIETLGTHEFVRVRLGIGRTGSEEEAARYVLAPIPPDLRETAGILVSLGQEAVWTLLNSGVEAAMRRFN
jgi:PTH1 family peptidyl-tRNA hydrolase